MRPLCCLEVSLAAPTLHAAAASGFPAPAPCVQQCKILLFKNSWGIVRFFKRNVEETIQEKIQSPILEDSTVDILYPIRRPMQCPILLPRVTSASSPTGPITVSPLHVFVNPSQKHSNTLCRRQTCTNNESSSVFFLSKEF